MELCKILKQISIRKAQRHFCLPIINTKSTANRKAARQWTVNYPVLEMIATNSHFKEVHAEDVIAGKAFQIRKWMDQKWFSAIFGIL